MTGLEKITDKIISDANAEARKIEACAEQRVTELRRKYSQMTDEAVREITQATEQVCADIIERAKSDAALYKRDTILAAQNDAVNSAFERALSEILSFPNEKYLTMLGMMLAKMLPECLEAHKNQHRSENLRIEVLLNSRDREYFSGTLMDELRRQTVGRLAQDVIDRVSISDDTAEISGGLIIRCGEIEYNSSLELLFRELRPELERRVYSILFEGEA